MKKFSPNVSVIGLGKLGACMAATMAGNAMQVIGVDVNPKTVELINQRLAPVVEPGLQELILANHARLRATCDFKEAVLRSEISFVIVPTPPDEQGGFALHFVLDAMKKIGEALREKPAYHLVVLTSTVLPQATETSILAALEKASGKKCGKDFGLCYNPEFIALGSVIHDLLHPDFILIGESDRRAGDILEQWYESYLETKPPIARMNFVNAELAKLSVNTYVTTKITFANSLANLCEALPGADIDTISAALGMDSRIGRRYLTGALGYGGPCFPRDNQALSYAAEKAGLSMPLAVAVDKTNRDFIQRTSTKITKRLKPGMRVAILGLAYKPDTNVVEESQGIALARHLSQAEIPVTVFDSLAMTNAKMVLKETVRYAPSLSSAIEDADAVVITLPSAEFKALTPERFQGRPVMVFDCWRILRDKLENASGITYVPLGVRRSAEKIQAALEEEFA